MALQWAKLSQDTKIMSHKKTDKLDNQNEKFGSLKITLIQLKVKLKNGRKYFQ